MAVATRPLAEALAVVVVQRARSQGLSVNHLARTIGVNKSTVHRRLRGRGELSIDQWDRVAAVLGTSLGDLLTAARPPADDPAA